MLRSRWLESARTHLRASLDLIWTPVCPACGQRAEHAREHFCEACWSALRPLRAEESQWTLALPEGDGLAARAAFAVDGHFLDALATSKYRRFRAVGRRLGREAARRVAGALPPAVLVPVPLRPDRRRERGFNQTEDYAAALAERTGAIVATHWLARCRGGRALAGLSRTERAAAVRGAFAALPAFPGEAAGPLLLVDDVVTTGSTAAACASALWAAGARDVGVVAMGRAFAPREDRPVLELAGLGRF